MHRTNKKYIQRSLFDWDMVIGSKDKLEKSIWQHIRKEIFEKVDEDSFSPLYSKKMGRPNTPINILVTLLSIKEMHDLTFRELESHMDYHIGVQYACGVEAGEQMTTLRTISNFIKSIRDYHENTGIDLFEKEFKRLVRDQINRLGISTKIARTDSTYFSTNVCSYNRLQFLIEIVKRVYRILEKEDKKVMVSMFRDYVKNDADNYVYNLRRSDLDEEFRKIGHCYYTLLKLFGDKYNVEKEWQLYLRVYEEQFRVTKEDKVELKPSKEMTSSSVRGVDDPEATLRHKSGENHLGFVGNVVETADPDNEINLISDASLSQNNTSDEKLLVDGFDELKEQTLPDLDELHFDAGYGGRQLDEKLRKYSVKGIQTAIKGVRTDHRMDVRSHDNVYSASCSLGEVVVLERTKKGFRAEFPKSKCSECKHFSKCPVKYLVRADAYVYDLKKEDLLKRIRLTNIKTIPKKRKTIRSGVEATVRQFKCHTKAGKTRLRGCYRHKLWFQFTALAINVKRIYQYATGAPKLGVNRRSSCFSILFCIGNSLIDFILVIMSKAFVRLLKLFGDMSIYSANESAILES